MWIAGHTGPTTFDEFTHWLPNARFLIENDAFADAGHPNLWSAWRYVSELGPSLIFVCVAFVAAPSRFRLRPPGFGG